MQKFKVQFHDTYQDKNLYQVIRAANEAAARAAILDNAPAFRFIVRRVTPVTGLAA